MNKHEQAKQELDAILAGLMTPKRLRESDKLLIAHGDEWREKISNTLKGRSLDELLGPERAEEGRKKRSENSKGPRPKAVGQKISATRKANGSYGTSMLGKEHKESTKTIMAQKAAIRQDLKRQLGLGKSDKVPRELLEKEYKKRGL